MVLFLSHSMKSDFHILLGNGFAPSGRPIHEGNLLEQETQLALDAGQTFCTYSPEVKIITFKLVLSLHDFTIDQNYTKVAVMFCM